MEVCCCCRQIARQHGVPFLETSAKSNVNVDKGFLDLTQAILDKVGSGFISLTVRWLFWYVVIIVKLKLGKTRTVWTLPYWNVHLCVFVCVRLPVEMPMVMVAGRVLTCASPTQRLDAALRTWIHRFTLCLSMSAYYVHWDMLVPWSDLRRVSLLSRCRILASAEHRGCTRQHLWQPMPRSRWQNSAAVWGDAAVCWLVNSRWRFCEKICNFVPYNIYCIAQLNENVTNFYLTMYVASLHVVNQQKKCVCCPK